MAGILVAAFSGGPSSLLTGAAPAATPAPTPSATPADFASALPSWVLTALIVLVALIIFGMFALTTYTMKAPEWTLRRMLGLKRGSSPPPLKNVSPGLISDLALSARTGKRTTRAILAVVGFSLLGVVIIAVFALSGQGVRDIRTQVIGSVTTLVAAIAGFYFGAQTAQSPAPGTPPAGAAPNSAPGLAPGPGDPAFTVGQHGSYTPQVTGTPPPKVTASTSLPSNLALDATTGTISGVPADGTTGGHSITLTASNGISPDATMLITLTISDPPAAAAVAGPAVAGGQPQPDEGAADAAATGGPAAGGAAAEGPSSHPV